MVLRHHLKTNRMTMSVNLVPGLRYKPCCYPRQTTLHTETICTSSAHFTSPDAEKKAQRTTRLQYVHQMALCAFNDMLHLFTAHTESRSWSIWPRRTQRRTTAHFYSCSHLRQVLWIHLRHVVWSS